MPRRKPASGKQKKAETQLKRAIKRGDAPPAEPKANKPNTRRRGPTGKAVGAESSSQTVESSRKLQSAFVKVGADFLEETKRIASETPLPRPLPEEASLFPSDLLSTQPLASPSERLSCPKRPKWRFHMTKKEVEKNEEGLFKKWLAQTDDIVDKWRHEATVSLEAVVEEPESKDEERASTPEPVIARAPTQFERNLEVWRQLWRVTEISQILLVLLDCRCPPLHFPPTLETYLGDRRVILVLTKVDIAGPERASAWEKYLSLKHPGRRIVQVESYTARTTTVFTQGASHPAFEPHIPISFRQQLVDALKATHLEMMQPPPHILANEEKAARWRPSAKRSIDWDAVMAAKGGQVGTAVGGAAAPRPAGDDETEMAEEPEYLTIGLIGQPNVGKSSLLNALFGGHKVRASRTPGKTKHFQTLFWTPEVRLVDCPGLVVPNLIPLELQVLCGILPISRVSAVSACIHYAANLIPLERILGLEHPSVSEAPVADKRTWRDGQQRPDTAAKGPKWTGMDILTAYAMKKGWVTAKAGRPDINRAGNAILRALAEGRIRWAFWLPEPRERDEASANGIWIEGDDLAPLTDDAVSADERAGAESATDDSEGEDEDESEGNSSDAETGITKAGPGPFGSKFGALKIEGFGDDEEGDDEEDEERDDGDEELESHTDS